MSFNARDYDYDEERAIRDEYEEIVRAAEERREEERRLEAIECEAADAEDEIERARRFGMTRAYSFIGKVA